MQTREEVVQEKTDLDEKIARLEKFAYGGREFLSETVSAADLDLISDQYWIMVEYAEALERRIRALKPTS